MKKFLENLWPKKSFFLIIFFDHLPESKNLGRIVFLSFFAAQMSSCLPRCFKEEDDRAFLLVKIKLLEEQVAAEIDEKLRLREQVQSLKVENDHANDVSINAQKELSYYEDVLIPDLKADILRLKQHDLKTNP